MKYLTENKFFNSLRVAKAHARKVRCDYHHADFYANRKLAVAVYRSKNVDFNTIPVKVLTFK